MSTLLIGLALWLVLVVTILLADTHDRRVIDREQSRWLP